MVTKMDGEEKHIWAIKPENEEEFNKMKGRDIYEAISAFFTGDDDIFKNRAGRWNIKTKEGKDYTVIKRLTIDGKNFNVNTTKNIRLTTCTGEIFHSSLLYYTDDEIDTELKGKNPGIYSSNRVMKYFKGKNLETGAIVITFNGRTRPEKIKLFSRVLDVKDHLPKPKRCTRCQAYRHTRRWCDQGSPTCSRCSETHETKDCKSDRVKCINCRGGDHYASSWDCPKYKEEMKIEEIRERERVTYREAAYKYHKINNPVPVVNPTKQDTTFAAQTKKIPQKQQTTSAECNLEMKRMQEDILEMKEAMKQQMQIIQTQSRLIWLVISKSLMNVTGEVEDCLRYLGSVNKSSEVSEDDGDDDDDTDEDSVMEEGEEGVQEGGKKRKQLFSAASNDSNNNFHLSRKAIKKMKNRASRAAIKAAANKAVPVIINKTNSGEGFYTCDYTQHKKEEDQNKTS